MKRHLSSKHDIDPTQHQCPECLDSFARHDILIRHKQNHHGFGKKVCQFCFQRVRVDSLVKHLKVCEDQIKARGKSVLRDVNASSELNPSIDNSILEQLQESWQNAQSPAWTIRIGCEVESPSVEDAGEEHGLTVVDSQNQGHSMDQSSESPSIHWQHPNRGYDADMTPQELPKPTGAQHMPEASALYDELGRVYLDRWQGGSLTAVSL